MLNTKLIVSKKSTSICDLTFYSFEKTKEEVDNKFVFSSFIKAKAKALYELNEVKKALQSHINDIRLSDKSDF